MELKEWLNSINTNKNNLIDEDIDLEKKYPSYIVNRCLSGSQDTLMLVNEINQYPHLDKKLQFDFLLNSVRARKRFSPWLKADKLENLEYVKEFYGYNNEKAKVALTILNDKQIATIKEKLYKGGRNGRS